MKMVIPIYAALLVACISYAEKDPPFDPWTIYDKLDPKLYEGILPPVCTRIGSTTCQFAADSIDIPFATATNTPEPAAATCLGGSSALHVPWPQRSWTIRGTTFSELIYVGTIEKGGKRLVCLAPPGLGLRAVPMEDLSEDDRQVVDAFETLKSDQRK